MISPSDIIIRNDFTSKDINDILLLHSVVYKNEFDYGIEFENYVREGLDLFVKNYDRSKDRVWICEHKTEIVGCVFLMSRDSGAQLRFFLVDPKFRGMKLGKKLMKMLLEFSHECNYSSIYLWTTHEQQLASEIYIKFGFELTEEITTERFGKKLIEQKYTLQ